ncbi:MAG TPA: tail fiber protein [Rhizomicrobium sp.]|jgi:microcystin-dependent protein
MAEPFVGQITMFGFNFPPSGWQFCAGQVLLIRQYSTLFSLLGNAYGGDGTTTFGLPNMQGYTPVGTGQGSGLSSYANGTTAGKATVPITDQNMATHTHTLTGTSTAGTSNSVVTTQFASAAFKGGKATGNTANFLSNAAGPMNPASTTTIGSVGLGHAHNNLQPSLTVNFSIAVSVGSFPPHS